MEIGEKLRNLRIQKNLTQEELGERTDCQKGIFPVGTRFKFTINGNILFYS